MSHFQLLSNLKAKSAGMLKLTAISDN